MHKKIASIVVAVMLVATYCFAQEARNPTYNHAGKTNVGSIGTTGLNVAGNPGYLEVMGTGTADDVQIIYYLWVDRTGDLLIASRTTLESFTSFPTGDWRSPNVPVGTVVGSQS